MCCGICPNRCAWCETPHVVLLVSMTPVERAPDSMQQTQPEMFAMPDWM